MVARYSLVLVVGCPRSGTTMLGAMLGRADEVLCTPEAQFVAELLPSDLSRPVDAVGLLAAIRRHWRFRLWNFDLRQPTAAELSGLETYRDLVDWVFGEYAASIGKPAASIRVDHAPENASYVARLRACFPDVRVIHLVRDGRAVASSVLPLDWGPTTIEGAALQWARYLALGYGAGRYLGEARVVDVGYEDLVRHPEREMQRLHDFLGLPPAAAAQGAVGLHLPRYTRHQHDLVGRPPDPSRIDAWRSRLSHRELQIFERMTGDLLVYHGYPLVAEPLPPPPTRAEWITRVIRTLPANVLRRIRERRRREAHQKLKASS